MKITKTEFLKKKPYSLSTIGILLFLTVGCGARTNETATKSSAENEEIKEEVIDDRRFGGCGKFRNANGDEAYMSVTHTTGEKYLEGICFGKNVNEPIWTGTFTGEIISSDTFLFEITVVYQINEKTVQVKEKWEKVNGFAFKLVEAEPKRPVTSTEYILINCINDFPEQQGFIDYHAKNSHIKAAKKFYQAIDVNYSVILELEYYDEIDEVTGMILGKAEGENMWYGLVSGKCINGRTDSLRVKVEFNEGTDEYNTSWQTWHSNKEFTSLRINPDNPVNHLGGNVFMPIDLPNGFPDKETFEKTYKDYHNEID